MKKQTTRSRTHKKLKETKNKQSNQISLNRFLIISFSAVVVLFSFILINKREIRSAVAGTSIARGLFAQSLVSLPNVYRSVYFNIYYKKSSDPEFSNAVRHVPTNIPSYTISYLKKGTDYVYKISAVDLSGREFWWSTISPMTNISAM